MAQGGLRIARLCVVLELFREQVGGEESEAGDALLEKPASQQLVDDAFAGIGVFWFAGIAALPCDAAEAIDEELQPGAVGVAGLPGGAAGGGTGLDAGILVDGGVVPEELGLEVFEARAIESGDVWLDDRPCEPGIASGVFVCEQGECCLLEPSDVRDSDAACERAE